MAEPSIVDLDGPLHVVDHGGVGPVMVLIHGLGGSHANWASVAAPLARHHKVLAIDLPGFGLTPPHGRPTTVGDFSRIVDRFVAEVVREPVILVGNSMGGLVAMMSITRDRNGDAPPPISALVLVNPAAPVPSVSSMNAFQVFGLLTPALPGLGPLLLQQYMSSRTPRQLIFETLRYITADPSRVERRYVEAAVAMAERRNTMPWAAAAFSDASRSVARLLIRRSRFDEMVRSIRVPTLLIHGAKDGVVLPAAARRLARLRPDWVFHEFADVGHVPQIETPAEFVTVVESWTARYAHPAPPQT